MTAPALPSDPQCPSCGRAIPFSDSLVSLGAPFRLRCSACGKALRLNLTRDVRGWLAGMLAVGVVVGAFVGLAFARWGNKVGALALVGVLVLSIVAEFVTHRYVARHGTFRVVVP